MTSAPISLVAVLIAVVLAAITAGSVIQLKKVSHGIKAIAAGLVLLLSSLVLALFQNTPADIQRVFTFRDAEEPFFIAGYVWGEYGILVGAIVGTVIVYCRRPTRQQHEA